MARPLRARPTHAWGQRSRAAIRVSFLGSLIL
jgi:hypothetical protein